MIRLVLFDMDGTLLDGRVVEALARALGYWPEAQRLFADYRAGSIEAKAVSARLASHLRGVPESRVREVAATVPLMPGARELVAELHERGVATAILSDSYVPAVEVTASRLGIGHVLANELPGPGGLCLGTAVSPTKGDACDEACVRFNLCKREGALRLAGRLGVDVGECAMIGDGEPDACAFRAVGLSIAFRAPPQVRAVAQHAVEEPDLGRVLPLLEPHLPPGRKRGVRRPTGTAGSLAR